MAPYSPVMTIESDFIRVRQAKYKVARMLLGQVRWKQKQNKKRLFGFYIVVKTGVAVPRQAWKKRLNRQFFQGRA
jgi:hypothetical protein